MMKSLRSSLVALAAGGLLFAASSVLAAAPNGYQITGTVSVLTDTTMTIVTLQKQNWEFARDAAATKVPDGMKVGDKVTVHYTMVAGAIDPKPEAAAKKTATKKADAPAATASPKP